MTITEFLQRHKLNDSLLLGFYGGGNYGDELLMEVLAGLLRKQRTEHVSIAYQHPEKYAAVHHEFGYPRVNIHDKRALLQTIFRKKHIVVGGGGLWGMDANLNVLLMSIMLFGARWLLGKKVHLVAVGYYNSATPLGRLGAWLAAKAATTIIARDQETYDNFTRLSRRTTLDTDIAWYIHELDLDAYKPDAELLDERVAVQGKTLFMTLRRFRGGDQDRLAHVIEDCLESNADKQIIMALMEPRSIDPEGYALLETWQQKYPHIQILDFDFNPLALFLFFRKHNDDLVFIGPQFHAILSAHLTGVPYLPLAYDNKVHNLLHTIAPATSIVTVNSLQSADVQRFIDTAYQASA
jgi:polysaccharide pyruvyl transferase WcaK-like protein